MGFFHAPESLNAQGHWAPFHLLSDYALVMADLWQSLGRSLSATSVDEFTSVVVPESRVAQELSHSLPGPVRASTSSVGRRLIAMGEIMRMLEHFSAETDARSATRFFDLAER